MQKIAIHTVSTKFVNGYTGHKVETKLDTLLEATKSSMLTSKTSDFVIGVSKFYISNRYITPKQYEAIDEIYSQLKAEQLSLVKKLRDRMSGEFY